MKAETAMCPIVDYDRQAMVDNGKVIGNGWDTHRRCDLSIGVEMVIEL